MLATDFHETATTMQPIEEYGKGRGKPYGKAGKHGQSQHGRGLVQLTWDANYERAERELGLNGALLKDFALAMRPDIAVAIMFTGMEEGWFTGKKLADYITRAKADYQGARRIINGTDRAAQIALYARQFEAALTVARYGIAPVPAPKPYALPGERFAGLLERSGRVVGQARASAPPDHHLRAVARRPCKSHGERRGAPDPPRSLCSGHAASSG